MVVHATSENYEHNTMVPPAPATAKTFQVLYTCHFHLRATPLQCPSTQPELHALHTVTSHKSRSNCCCCILLLPYMPLLAASAACPYSLCELLMRPAAPIPPSAAPTVEGKATMAAKGTAKQQCINCMKQAASIADHQHGQRGIPPLAGG